MVQVSTSQATRGFRRPVDLGFETGERVAVGMPDIDREQHFRRHDRGHVGPDLHHADGEAMLVVDMDRMLKRVDHPRGFPECVAASRFRRGARVRLLAGYTDAHAAYALDAGHHADGFARAFERRALLDLRLDERRKRNPISAFRARRAARLAAIRSATLVPRDR